MINNLVQILFVIIFINFLPLIIPNSIGKESFAVSNSFMIICYLIELAILFYVLLREYIKSNKSNYITKEMKINLVLLIIMTIVLLGVQVYNFINKELIIKDVLNLGCIVLNIFVLYICMINIKLDEYAIFTFFKGIIIFALIACIANFVIYYENILGIFKIGQYDRAIMIKSFFANKNQFAFVLYIAIIANTFILRDRKNLFYTMTLIIFLFSIYVTMSRTGILMIAMFLLLLFLFSEFKISFKIGLILFSISLILISGLYIYKYKPEKWSRIDSTLLRSDDIKDLAGRSKIWEKGIEILKEKPQNLIVGVGRFKALQQLENVGTRKFTQFHNIYLDILTTGGLVEFAYILYIFISVIKNIAFSSMDNKYKKVYMSMFITYFIYIALESYGRFSIGASDTICFIFFITMPLLHVNSIKE